MNLLSLIFNYILTLLLTIAVFNGKSLIANSAVEKEKFSLLKKIHWLCLNVTKPFVKVLMFRVQVRHINKLNII